MDEITVKPLYLAGRIDDTDTSLFQLGRPRKASLYSVRIRSKDVQIHNAYQEHGDDICIFRLDWMQRRLSNQDYLGELYEACTCVLLALQKRPRL